MKTILKPVLLAAALLAGSSSVALAAPAASAYGLNGMAMVDSDAAMKSSLAFKVALQQQQVTYKPVLDQAEARKAQLQAQLRPLAEKFEKDRATANFPQATLQQEYQQYKQAEDAGTQELQKIWEPIALSGAYVQEQIADKVDDAVKAAMARNGISVVLAPGAVPYAPNNFDMTQAVVDELNRILPNVQIAPPAGWMPRQMREQQAAQAAAQARGTAGAADGR